MSSQPRARRAVRLLSLVLLSATVLGADCGAGSGGASCPATGPCRADDEIQAEIRGVIVDSDENPVAGATVETEPPTSSPRTASNGRFSIGLPTPIEGYTITVVARHEAVGEATIEVYVTPENPTHEIRLMLRPPPPSPPDTEVRTIVSDASLGCIFEGDPVEFQVDVRNGDDAAAEGVVVHDTLSPETGFSRPLRDSDVTVDRARFPDAVVAIHPDGFSFSVALGDVAPTGDDFVRAYTVSLPAGAVRGTRCNRIVARRGEGTVFDEDTGCVTETAVLALHLAQDDGALQPDGSFDDTVDVFHVGDGSAEDPDALVYRIEVGNDTCTTQEGTRVVAELDPTGIVAYRQPVEGYPTKGTLAEASDGRFVWEIGDLPYDEPGVLLIRAEALAAGSTVGRVELTTSTLTGAKIDEEPTRVEP